MAPKRKLDPPLDDEKFLLTMFQESANNLSHFYAKTVDQQKLAFEAGETYSILKLNEWMINRLQDGKSLNVNDIFGYLRGKLNLWIPGLDIPEAGGSSSEPCTRLQLGPSTSSAPNPQNNEGSSDMNIDGASEGKNCIN